MSTLKTIIEIHYFSGGLKTILIGLGSPNRPDWLPDYDLVGLHNDISPKDNEFVIELSRHKRKDRLISWIGVYTKGNDAIYGDRSNYIGIGIWLINSLPFNADLIIDALIKICQLLASHGPSDNIQSQCSIFLDDEDYLQSWIRSLDILPRINNGIVFDTTLHPKTIYVKSTNQDLETSIKKISDSILLNCINAEKNIKGASRVLYLLLNPTSKIENIENINQLGSISYSINSLLEYFSSSIEETNSRNIKLEDQYKKLSAINSNNVIKIEELTKNLENLKGLNQEINFKYDQLRQNQKTPGQLLEELKYSVANLSTLNNADKDNLLRIIQAIDKNRAIRFDNNFGDNSSISRDNYNNLMSKLNDISKNINYLKNNLYEDQATFNPSNNSNYNESDNHLFGFSYALIIYITVAALILGAIVFLVLHFFPDK